MRKVILSVFILLLLMPLSAIAESDTLMKVAEQIEGNQVRELVDSSNKSLEGLEEGSIMRTPNGEVIEKKQKTDESVIREKIRQHESEIEKIVGNKQTILQSEHENLTTQNIEIIDIDDVVVDTLNGAYEAKGYLFYNPQPQKLTVRLINPEPTHINYDLYLAGIDELGQFTDIVYSLYEGGRDQQVSQIVDEGIYYIEVASNAEYDPNEFFGFFIVQSENFDQNEPDDNVWQANMYTNQLFVQNSIDNSLDQDWIRFTVTEESPLTLKLENNPSLDYYVTIYSSSLNELGIFDQNEVHKLIFSSGVYFIKVESLGAYDPSSNYKLSIHETQEPFRVNVTKVGSMSSIEGYVNYGYGHMWRVQYHMDIHGRLLDKDGRPIANEFVEVVTWSGINNKEESNFIMTNANGEFNPSLTLEHAVGRYSYYTGSSTHYFDIIPLRFYSSDGRHLISNEFELYHFAYSMYGG